MLERKEGHLTEGKECETEEDGRGSGRFYG
jgi:hypothetical protein